MDKYLTRQPQPARADSQAKRRQLAPAQQLPKIMAPARDTTPEVPETPQGSQEAQSLLIEDQINRAHQVAPRSLSARETSQAARKPPSGPVVSGGAATAEEAQHQISDVAKQLIQYTGSEARRQIAFTRGQMQKAPVLNPFLLEMEKLRDHRPARGELPFNWQRAREEGGVPAQPAATATASEVSDKVLHLSISSRVNEVDAQQELANNVSQSSGASGIAPPAKKRKTKLE